MIKLTICGYSAINFMRYHGNSETNFMLKSHFEKLAASQLIKKIDTC
jgi:hypothetical protein